MGEYKQISVDSIVLDDANPRLHEPLAQDALLAAFAQDPKVRKLAKHIAEHGANPMDLICVTPDAKGRYVVREGNRRIAAHKLLRRPALAGTEQATKAFKKLADNAHHAIEAKRHTYVADTPEEAAVWIRLKHSGEQEGAGTVPWDAIQTARFESRLGGAKNEPALQLVTTAVDRGWVAQGDVANVKITNLSRVLGSKKAREALGFDVIKGELSSTLDVGNLQTLVTQLVTDASPGGVQVRDIYKATQIVDYANKLVKDLSLETKGGPPKPVSSPAKSNPPKRSKEQVDTAKRTHLINDLKIQGAESRLQAIYFELKKHLNVQTEPNAVGVLFRVFVELSICSYLRKQNVSFNEMDKLQSKIEKACVQLKKTTNITDHQIAPIRKACGNDNSLLSAHTFNQIVHNANMRAIPSELNIMWERISPFMAFIWA